LSVLKFQRRLLRLAPRVLFLPETPTKQAKETKGNYQTGSQGKREPRVSQQRFVAWARKICSHNVGFGVDRYRFWQTLQKRLPRVVSLSRIDLFIVRAGGFDEIARAPK